MSDDKEKQPLADNAEDKMTEKEKEASGAVPDETYKYRLEPDDPNLDDSKVKFINGGAGAGAGATDAHVDIEGQTHLGESEFVGLSKEELMKYANDPYWVKVRWVMLVLFWVIWLAMLGAAIAIIVVAPKCPPRPKLDWWQKSVIYQVYPRSFQDTNDDGVGDLKGIENHLGHLKDELNVSALWLNPIYASPDKDFGYDISDFKSINPVFGTMEDFENLKASMHKKEMKLIMDFVPNHTSRNHTWFAQSRASKDPASTYHNYYVWHKGHPTKTVPDGKGGRMVAPPNNWMSVFGGPAWSFDEVRGEYYLHQFLPEQPDLNARNRAVLEEYRDILKFWLDKGVDGFRMDAVSHLVEVANFTDKNEPESNKGVGSEDYDFLDHIYTTYQPETYEIVTTWRQLLDEVSTETEKPRFMIIEAYGDWNKTGSFYMYKGMPGAHMPFNMQLTELKKGCNGKCVSKLVANWMSNMKEDQWPNWVTGNHDKSRVATRMGQEWVNAVNMLLMTLPGTATTYYGEEIGMHDVDVSYADTQDGAAKNKGQSEYKKYTRDPQRTPMQWEDSKNAGFSNANDTWLPVAGDYTTRNVKTQQAHGIGVTELEVYQCLTLLRQEPSLMWGKLHYAVLNDNVFSYIRQAEGFDGYLVAINFGTDPVTLDFNAALPTSVPSTGVIVANTANFEGHAAEELKIEKEVNLKNLYLQPQGGIVVRIKHGLAEEEAAMAE